MNAIPETVRTEPVRLTAIEELAPGVFNLSIPRDRDFIPGQLVALTVDPEIPPRLYSIAAGRGGPDIEILFDVVAGGLLTPRLARLLPGDVLYVSEPFGTFRDERGPSVWIATGTRVWPPSSRWRARDPSREGH